MSLDTLLPIFESFERQARVAPDKIALQIDDATLTYRELELRSLALASWLGAQGVGPEVLCAICVDRSFEMVIGILGILRAGAAYVPLNPSDPPDRLVFMAEDSDAPILLTQAHLLNRLPPTKARVVCLDRDWSTIAAAPSSPAPRRFDNRLVYMIYTSGSTGRPKGALNHHIGVCNRLAWMQNTYRLTVNDRVLQKTPFSFDVSVWEFLWPLLVGARLVIAKPEGHRDADYLSRLVEHAGVTVMHFVPSMLHAFLEIDALETRCRSLTQVMCSGEALPPETTRRFFTRLPQVRLHNLYGPTEAAIDVTAYEVRPNDTGSTVPIGRAIANTTMWVLDAALRPVPDGEPGELYIGGVQVGRGYHRRADLTAERFVPHPLEVGQRLYRTGDLGRRLPDGNLEYLGRLDHQVKIRGFRIELGEIEHALVTQPGVGAAVVIAHTDADGTQRLVAYVVPHDPELPPEFAQLRAELSRSLPAHMMPARFITLAALPLTPNGKLDRKALPAPIFGSSRAMLVEPRDHVEFELRRIWETIFDRRPIGVTDDFFDHGGNSLQAVRLMGEIDCALSRRLAPAEILRTPTIEGLAITIRAAGELPPASSLVPLQRGSSRPLFLVHPIGGNVLCYVELARKLGLMQTVYGLQARGLDGNEPPLTDNEAMVTRYLSLIRGVQPSGPYHLGGYSSGGMLAYMIAQRLTTEGEHVELLFNLDGRAPVGDARETILAKTRNFDDALMAFWMLVVLSRTIGVEVSAEFAEFQYLDEGARIDHLLSYLQRYGLIPPRVGRWQMRAALEVYKANMRALADTKLKPYTGEMILLKAIDRLPDREDAPNPPPWGWGRLCSRIEEHDVSCNHFTLLWKQNLDQVADILREHLKCLS